MLLYVDKDELNELYEALVVYNAEYKHFTENHKSPKLEQKIRRIEDILNKITYECMYYSDTIEDVK